MKTIYVNGRKLPKTPTRKFLVVLESDPTTGPIVYLGELDRGFKCGVRRVENATRYTAVGAKRVAAGFRGGSVVEVAA